MQKDPSTCSSDAGYKSGIEQLKKSFVANDVAERDVKFIQKYANIVRKNESDK